MSLFAKDTYPLHSRSLLYLLRDLQCVGARCFALFSLSLYRSREILTRNRRGAGRRTQDLAAEILSYLPPIKCLLSLVHI